jgi:hypothetical protein
MMESLIGSGRANNCDAAQTRNLTTGTARAWVACMAHAIALVHAWAYIEMRCAFCLEVCMRNILNGMD